MTGPITDIAQKAKTKGPHWCKTTTTLIVLTGRFYQKALIILLLKRVLCVTYINDHFDLRVLVIAKCGTVNSPIWRKNGHVVF